MKLVEETVAAEPVDYDCTDQQISENVSTDYTSHHCKANNSIMEAFL